MKIVLLINIIVFFSNRYQYGSKKWYLWALKISKIRRISVYNKNNRESNRKWKSIAINLKISFFCKRCLKINNIFSSMATIKCSWLVLKMFWFLQDRYFQSNSWFCPADKYKILSRIWCIPFGVSSFSFRLMGWQLIIVYDFANVNVSVISGDGSTYWTRHTDAFDVSIARVYTP